MRIAGLVFFDDAIPFLSLVKEHSCHVPKSLRISESARVWLNLSKIELFCTSTTYFSHIIKPQSQEIEDWLTKALKEKNAFLQHKKRKLRSFSDCLTSSGLLTFTIASSKNFAYIAGPLNDRLRKKVTIRFRNFLCRTIRLYLETYRSFKKR